jgi:hypothetical protein
MLQLRFITPLLLLIALALPCSGCVRSSNCPFVSPSATSGPVIPEGFGVNIDFTDPRPGELALLAQSGVRWVRMDLKWDQTEKEPGRYDFTAYERLMKALESERLRVLFILDYGNPLYQDGAPPRNEATRQAFARWAVAAAKHFGGRGALWEVYNEPNHSLFWPPKPNVQEYVELALAVGRAFRAAVPDEKLIGPATSEIDFDFVESCFKAGLLEYWSAVSVHPYRRSDPETAAQDYCRLRELINKYAPARTGSSSDRVDAAKQISIISSEWGYSAVWPNLSEEKQGELLARAWLTNVANGITLSIWYDWHDDGTDTREAEHHFGLVANTYHDGRTPVYDPKPAYTAARALTTFFSGYRFESRIETGRAEDYVLAFRKGDELRFAAWTSSNRSSEVVIPLGAGDYVGIKHTGQELGKLTSDQKGLPLRLTTAPVYLRLNH